MTWALCFNCGEVKFGAICPCPNCEIQSTGDINLDIAFSDHNMTKETLDDFGKVVRTIHSRCDDSEICFWTFIRYVSIHHPSILGVNLDPEVALKCDELLSQISLPIVHLTAARDDSPSDSSQAPDPDIFGFGVRDDSPPDSSQSPDRKPWWKFWHRPPKR